MAKILFFGRLQDQIDSSEKSYVLPGEIQTTEQLRTHLDAHWNFEGALLEESVRIAVNGVLAQVAASICDQDEIAFLPPVGGG